MREISTNLKNALNQKNMTCAALAEKIGVSKASISLYVNDKRIPKADIIGDIAEVLGVTTDYLINGSEEAEN